MTNGWIVCGWLTEARCSISNNLLLRGNKKCRDRLIQAGTLYTDSVGKLPLKLLWETKEKICCPCSCIHTDPGLANITCTKLKGYLIKVFSYFF